MKTPAFLTFLAVAALAGGCKSETPAEPAKPVPTTGAEKAPAAAPKPEPPPAAEAPPVEAAPAEPPAPADPVEKALAEFEQALLETAKCPKKQNSIRAEDQNACLAPVKEKKAALRSPQGELANAPDARQRLRDGLAKLLMKLLDHEDPTVVLHALMYNQADLSVAEGLEAKLTELLEKDQEDIAEWAAITRFWRRDPADEATSGLAKKLFDAHKHERVRLAACQYLGDATFRGKRDHFDVLAAEAKDAEAAPLLRSCAVTRLGYVGSDEDIPALLEHLAEPRTQYAALYALQRGLKSEKAVKAYVDWFEKHAGDEKAIHWGSLTLFVPKVEVPGFPDKKAAKVLSKLASRKDLHHRGRALAAEGLASLGAKAELEKLLKQYGKATEGDDLEVKKALEGAIASLDQPKPAEGAAPEGAAPAPAPAPAPPAPSDGTPPGE